MVLQKKSTNRLSKMFNNDSTPDLRAPATNHRRAVSQQHAPLPDRSTNQNAPWMPPQTQQRAVSAQVPNTHLAPIDTNQDFLRNPISHHQRAISANSSPVNAYSANGLYTIPSNRSANAAYAPVQPVSAHPSQTLPVPGAPAEPASATSRKDKRKSWFGGSGAKLSKAGKDEAQKSPASWILGHGDQRPAYDTTALLSAYKVCLALRFQ
jgi:hypothetical protein